MSFVLEALKKQEADRDPDAAVSLARAATHRRRHRLWMGLFGVAMLANLALLAWVLDPLGLGAPPAAPPAAGPPAVTSPGQREASGAGARPAPAHPAEEPAAASRPADSAPRQAASAPAPVAAEAPESARARAPVRPGPARTRLADLPADVRARFPGIAFSTHVYGEDPELRAVVANGQRLQEGDRIRGLEIVAITAGGVVLAFEDYQVEVPVVVDWDSL